MTEGERGVSDRRRTQIRVGLFVVLLLATGLGFVFVLGAKRHVFQEQATLHAQFENVEGLRPGAPVRLAGVDVGSVSRVAFARERHNAMVQVDLKITRTALARIGADSVARIGSEGLLGDKTIDISMASPDSAPLEPGATVASAEPTDLNRLIELAGATLAKTEKVADNAAAALQPFAEPRTAEDIRRALAGVRTLIGTVVEGPGLAHSLFYDRRQADALHEVLVGMDRLVTHVDHVARGVDEIVSAGGEDSRHLVAHMARAARTVGDTAEAVERSHVLDNLSRASKDLAEMTAYARSGQGTIGALLADPAVYEQIVTILGGIGRSRILRALVRFAIARDEERSAGKQVGGEVAKPSVPGLPAGQTRARR